jgi:hypothetical protein
VVAPGLRDRGLNRDIRVAVGALVATLSQLLSDIGCRARAAAASWATVHPVGTSHICCEAATASASP